MGGDGLTHELKHDFTESRCHEVAGDGFLADGLIHDCDGGRLHRTQDGEADTLSGRQEPLVERSRRIFGGHVKAGAALGGPYFALVEESITQTLYWFLCGAKHLLCFGSAFRRSPAVWLRCYSVSSCGSLVLQGATRSTSLRTGIDATERRRFPAYFLRC